MKQRGKTGIVITALFFTGLICDPLQALAQDDYQTEIKGSYNSTDADVGIDSETMLVGVQIFFNPVSYKNHPYAEAAFLDHASSAYLAYGTVDVDVDFEGLTTPIKPDGNILNAGFNYASNGQPFILGFFRSDSDADTTVNNVTVDFSVDTNIYYVGLYLDDHSTVALAKTNNEIEVNNGRETTTLGETDILGIAYKSVFTVQSDRSADLKGNRFVNIELGYSKIESDNDPDDLKNRVISIGGDFYFDRRSSIGLTFAQNTGDDESIEGDTITLSAKQFLNRQTALSFSYESFSGDLPKSDSTAIGVSISHRIK